MNETGSNLPVLGFLGTGTLTASLVTGFCRRAADTPYPIVLSPRTRERAAGLAETWPDRITVAQSMQEVLDRSDWVILAVLPKAAEEVCRSLRFRPDHRVITVMANIPLPDIRSWIGETAQLVHVLPSTFNEFCDGPILVTPPNPEAEEIFGHIGRIVELEHFRDTAVLTALTASIMPLYRVMESMVGWAVEQGTSRDLAAEYLAGFFQAICTHATQIGAEGMQEMARVATPGGLNFLATEYIAGKNGFGVWAEAMNPVMKRLERLAGSSRSEKP